MNAKSPRRWRAEGLDVINSIAGFRWKVASGLLDPISGGRETRVSRFD
jgi:hypothetical protein